MIRRIHLVSLAIALSVIVSIIQIPSIIANSYDTISKTTGLTKLSFVSSLISCNYFLTGIEVYQDGSSVGIGTDTISFNPTLALVSPNGLKIVDHYMIYPQITCVAKGSNISSFVLSDTFSGTFQIYAKVMGTDGNYHVILNQAYTIPPTTVPIGQSFKFGSYTIPASGIAQYNTASGTSTSIIDFSNEPILTIYTNLASGYGDPQKSIWSSWADIRYLATVNNSQQTPTSTQTSTVTNNQCPSGIFVNNQCKPTSGSTITTADIKFAYSMSYYGDSGNTCGAGTGTPAGQTCTISASGTSNIPLTALAFIPSSTASTNSLSSLTAQLLIYPKTSGLVLDSSNVGYTGTLAYSSPQQSVTINIPSSLIQMTPTPTQQGGIFAFGTAVIDPNKIDSLLQTNGIKTSMPVPVTISIYAIGNFQGHSSSGNFKGIVDGTSMQLKTYYVSSALSSNTCQLTSDPCNKNICHDLSGNVISCYIPPVTGDPTQQSILCTIYSLDSSCAKANPPNQQPPVCNSSDPTIACIPLSLPPDPQNPPVNTPCYGSCTPSLPATTTTPSTSSTVPSSTISTGQFFTSGLPTASATSAGAAICPNSTTAQDCANFLASYIQFPALNQNIIIIIMALIATVGIIIYVIKRSKKN